MIHQEILKGLTLSIGNGGMSLDLKPKINKSLWHTEGAFEEHSAKITKHDGGVYMNGVLIPFVSPNDINEGESDPRKIAKMVLRSIKIGEMKKNDSTYANNA